MCRLLIYAKNQTHADPVKDRMGCYKRGMIVAMFDDAHVWGMLESKQVFLKTGLDKDWPGDFVCVDVPGLALSDVPDLCCEQNTDDRGAMVFNDRAINTEKGPDPAIFRRREWAVQEFLMPRGAQEKMERDGEIKVTRRQARTFITRIRDKASHPGI